MLLTNIIMIALLYYQVTMPAIDNAKYAVTVVNGKVVRMNTQNGAFEQCNEKFVCENVSNKEENK